MEQSSRTVRLASLLFFVVCFPLALWDGFYVPGKIFVPLDPASTADNLLNNEFIFRTAIFTRLAGFVVFVLMMMLFHRVFKQTDQFLSNLMLYAVLAMLPVVFVFEAFNYAALMTLKSEARTTFTTAQQQEAAYFLLRLPRFATSAGMGKLFIGLSLIPFGMLVLRSMLAPRIIGILLIIGGVGYVIDCSIAILLQRSTYVLVRSYLMYTTFCYMAAFMWFLIKGFRKQI